MTSRLSQKQLQQGQHLKKRCKLLGADLAEGDGLGS